MSYFVTLTLDDLDLYMDEYPGPERSRGALKFSFRLLLPVL